MIGTHLDIFSGIGGFAIAAREAGFETVAFCESDSRCREFLENTWGLPVEPDVRKLDGRKYRGISLLTGGPPCQPASRAGKQGGEGDDRWLWPEALRVLDEAKPDCVVFENPPGILDVGIDGILSAMGRSGYEVQCFDIPACAVDSPQLRHRIWIVGFSRRERSERKREFGIVAGPSGQAESEARQREWRGDAARDSGEAGYVARTGRERSGQDEQERGPEGRAVDRRDCADELADTQGVGRREAERRASGNTGHDASATQSLVADSTGTRQNGEAREEQHFLRRPLLPSRSGDSERSNWANAIWVPCADGKLRRAPDDSFDLVDGLHRSLLGALGNSICPQVATEILIAVAEVLR